MERAYDDGLERLNNIGEFDVVHPGVLIVLFRHKGAAALREKERREKASGEHQLKETP